MIAPPLLAGGVNETDNSLTPSVTTKFVGASGATGGVAATTDPSTYAITKPVAVPPEHVVVYVATGEVVV